MMKHARFEARVVRDALLRRGGPTERGFVRHAYRPFDTAGSIGRTIPARREKSPDYKPHVFKGNLWLVSQQKPRRGMVAAASHLAHRLPT